MGESAADDFRKENYLIVFDAIQLKRAAAQLKRAVAILAVDPKDYRALSYVAARACKQVNSIMSSAPTQRAKYGVQVSRRSLRMVTGANSKPGGTPVSSKTSARIVPIPTTFITRLSATRTPPFFSWQV